MHSALGNFFYLNLFLIHILLSVDAVAENINSDLLFTEQELTDEKSETDVSSEKIEDITEDNPLNNKSEKHFLSFLDTPQEVISSGVEAFAKNIDEFFSNNKVFYETSGTYLRLRADTIVNEAGIIGYEGDVKIKLRLPNIKRKLKFTFESDVNESQDEVTSQPENTPLAAVEKKDYFAGLQAILGREDAWRFNPSIGVRLGSRLKPYIRFRAKRKYEFNKWSLRWHETPYWVDSIGWGLDSYIEFNRKITDKGLFRASTFARWTNKSDQFELSQVFSMYHTINKRQAISYFSGVYGISEPTVFATHYLLGLAYRQNIRKDYLFIELIPQIKYQKINDFHAEHSIILRLEMVFKK